MIPKKIHFCWLGSDNYPNLTIECIESWKKYLLEYEIILWNTENFDITCNKYVEQAYSLKKWAFVSDYVRLFSLYKYGGIYLDSDVEILKPLDKFLSHSAFVGFEDTHSISTGLIGSKPGNKWIEALLRYYDNRSFLLPDGKIDFTTNVVSITEISKKYGFIPQNQYHVLNPGDVHVYPAEYFSPLDYSTKRLNITDNTYAIHHFAGSWVPFNKKIKYNFARTVRRTIGDDMYERLKQVNYLKNFYSKL